MNPDILARIDAALAILDRAHKMSISGPDVPDDATTYGLGAVALRDARAELVRLSALIPEPTEEMVDVAIRVLEEREFKMTSVQDDMRAALEAALGAGADQTGRRAS